MTDNENPGRFPPVVIKRPEDWESDAFKAHVAEIVAQAPPLPRKVVELLRAARAQRLAEAERVAKESGRTTKKGTKP